MDRRHAKAATVAALVGLTAVGFLVDPWLGLGVLVAFAAGAHAVRLAGRL